MAADQHLQDLKRDLEATLEDWRRSEQERDAKDKVNSQLQTVLQLNVLFIINIVLMCIYVCMYV